MNEPNTSMNQEQKGVSIDELRQDIEEQFQELCHKAKLGGPATLDELADVVSNMCRLVEVVDGLMAAVMKLQDKKQ